MPDSEAERPATDRLDADPVDAGPVDAGRLEADLLAAEQALQTAQRHGDVAALDVLLDDRLIAIGPDGGRYTKQDDLDAYRMGSSVVEDLLQESLEHLIAGHTGVTFFTGTVSGTFGGEPVTARMRYTRTWTHTGGRWRILAAHIAPA